MMGNLRLDRLVGRAYVSACSRLSIVAARLLLRLWPCLAHHKSRFASPPLFPSSTQEHVNIQAPAVLSGARAPSRHQACESKLVDSNSLFTCFVSRRRHFPTLIFLPNAFRLFSCTNQKSFSWRHTGTRYEPFLSFTPPFSLPQSLPPRPPLTPSLTPSLLYRRQSAGRGQACGMNSSLTCYS